MRLYSSYLFLAIAFTLNAAANVLVKIAADKGFKPVGEGTILKYVIHNSTFLLGLVCFGLNVMFYYLALRSIPLVAAYPVMVGMSFLIISFFSFWYFHEKVTAFHIFGTACILIGIVSISYKAL